MYGKMNLIQFALPMHKLACLSLFVHLTHVRCHEKKHSIVLIYAPSWDGQKACEHCMVGVMAVLNPKQISVMWNVSGLTIMLFQPATTISDETRSPRLPPQHCKPKKYETSKVHLICFKGDMLFLPRTPKVICSIWSQQTKSRHLANVN